MFVAIWLVAALYVVAILFLVLTPAAITLMKGQVALFIAGFVTVGLVWVIAEFRLARPNSPWARRFYGPQEQRRSQARYPNISPEEPDGSLVVLAAVFGVFALAVLAGFVSVLTA